MAPSGAEGDRPGRGATFISEMRHGGHRFSTGGQVMLQGELAGWLLWLVGPADKNRVPVPYIALCALLWRPRARAPVGKTLDHDEHGCRWSKLECFFILVGGTMGKLARWKRMLNRAVHNASIICPITAQRGLRDEKNTRKDETVADQAGPRQHRVSTAWTDSGYWAINNPE